MRKNCQRSAGIGCRFPETLNEKGGGSVARWLWIFWIYSFLGYGLEKVFAAAAHSPNQGRKCFLLLPLCPVYGLGMLAVLALPVRGLWLVLWGGLAATAVEYGYHWACEVFLGVQFWNYARVPGNLRGRVCLPFTVIWGLLTALAVWWVQPWVESIAAVIPWQATYIFLLIFTADAVCSAQFLRKTHDIEALRWG